MPEMTQITRIADLGGKTIKGAIEYEVGDAEEHGVLVFRFTDDSFFWIEPGFASMGKLRIYIDELPESNDERVKLGIITQEECDALEAAAQALKDHERQAFLEEKDRAEYARLMAKFKGKS